MRLFIDSGLDFISIEALVRVVWKDLNLGDNEDYRTGVKFVEISAQDDSNLRNFLNSLIELKTQPKLSLPARMLSSASSGLESVPGARPKIRNQK